MELFVDLLILIFIKIIEWSCALIKFMFKAIFSIFVVPFRAFSKVPNRKLYYFKPKPRKVYSDPFERAEDHWDNSPEDLDLEDIFWLDELIGDD